MCRRRDDRSTQLALPPRQPRAPDRYLAEFDSRYTTCKLSDTERIDLLVSRTGGRRLMYREPAGA